MNNEVITYTENVVFNYVLPDDDTTHSIEKDLTLIWENDIDALLKEKGEEVEYKIHTFSNTMQQNYFIHKIEETMDEDIEEVEEDIANKTKFGFEFSGQLHNDD